MANEQCAAELEETFRRLGAHEPESWARSEIEENIPQLARFLFLRAAWRCVVSEDDNSWIDRAIETSERHPNAPCAGIGPALNRLLAEGVDRQDIVDIVRVKQYETLFDLCYLLDDPGDLEPELEEMHWVLHEVGQNGRLTGRIVQGLYESLLSMDPTGREMCPRS
ncbi:MAG: hypothetical protein JXR84_17045 [Anaerolineae bacterium]|nr:hypothetical protein [Anaerolineae bacterium]